MNKKTRITSAAVVALAGIFLAAGITQLPPASSGQAGSETESNTHMGNNASRDPAVTGHEHYTSFQGVDSYAAIYHALTDLNSNVYAYEDAETSGSLFSFGVDKATSTDSASGIEIMEEASADQAGDISANQYSQTNIQEKGVDEADIIKTDGQYLYICEFSGRVRIITADGADSRIIASIEPAALEETVMDMYVDNDTLNLITTGCETKMQNTSADSGPTSEFYLIADNYYTTLYTYDISDRSCPKLCGTISQEGYYSTSRKNGEIVYLFTSFCPNVTYEEDISAYVPEVNGALLKESDICLPEYISTSDYLIISSVDINNPSETVDSKGVISAAENFYVSTENIYIMNTDWFQETRTQLMKFHYDGGKITTVDAANLKGYLNDSFSLNEYNGYLRIVLTETNSGTETNSLYVLDDSLNICGSIRNIAQGETIQSARFLGDTGYFVTYRNMDPLFSVDLSDPSDPKILGELKITGFSSYLHFYGKDRLLGIGYETDPYTGQTYGLKLSMFDTSDPVNVKEIQKYVIKNAWDCSVLSDYKSVMLDPQKNVIGFSCDNQYLIFTYDEKSGFQTVFTKNLNNGSAPLLVYDIGYGYARGCYVNNTFYLIQMNDILIYDMENSYNPIGKIEL